MVPPTSLLQTLYAGSVAGSNNPAIRADFNGNGRDDLAIGVLVYREEMSAGFHKLVLSTSSMVLPSVG
jgi:hypothetical protein